MEYKVSAVLHSIARTAEDVVVCCLRLKDVSKRLRRKKSSHIIQERRLVLDAGMREHVGLYGPLPSPATASPCGRSNAHRGLDELESQIDELQGTAGDSEQSAASSLNGSDLGVKDPLPRSLAL